MEPIIQDPIENQDPVLNLDYSNFVPVLRFIVASDVHIQSESDNMAKRLTKMLESAYRYAESDANYSKLDAFVIVGDLVESGSSTQYALFKRLVTQSIKPETQLITIMGNHDIRNEGVSNYERIIDSKLNKDIEINGFHFIAISTQDEVGSYDAESLDWLENCVFDAILEDPEKPIFTFQHHKLKDTVYGSYSAWSYAQSWESIEKIYQRSSRIINFSGHTHTPISPASIYQDNGFTNVGLGSSYYLKMDNDQTTDGRQPENFRNTASYFVVEVDAENRVRMMPYNVIADDFYKTPSLLDDENEQLVFYVDKPSHAASFRYLNAKEKAEKPYFAADSQISVTRSGNQTQISIPQAMDRNCVLYYDIKITSGNETVKELRFYSQFYFEPMPNPLSIKTETWPGGTYTVTVTPTNIYYVVGDSIGINITLD